MIPAEVESLQTQLTNGELNVEEFFAILLSTYEFDSSKEIFNPSVILLNPTMADFHCHFTVHLYRNLLVPHAGFNTCI